MRRIVQATAWYPPYDVGGTEIYLEGLIGALEAIGVRNTVLAPRHAQAPSTYEHCGVPVETYSVNEVPRSGEIRQHGQHTDFEAFVACLRRNSGGIYHQHSWTRGCGPNHLQAARELGFQTVVTVHVAGNLCLRGSMLKFGATPCDGRVDEERCAACWGHGRGLPKSVAGAVAGLPAGLSETIRRHPGRLATALGARGLARRQRETVARMIKNSDRIVAVCSWLGAALEANGAPKDKIILNRHGITSDFQSAATKAREARQASRAQLRLLYLGRWDRAKGIDVLVRAMRGVDPAHNVQLTIHASQSTADPGEHEARVRALAGADPRISFEGGLPREQVPRVLAQFDVLAVPSQVMETGPLVVLEAQAAGLHVLGSRLGGIAELADGPGGTLVEPQNVSAWTKAIERLTEEHAAGRLVTAIKTVRGMDMAAGEMAAVYQTL